MIKVIDNFLTQEELKILEVEIAKGQWYLEGKSLNKPFNPIFWYNNIFNTSINKLFTDKIQFGLKRKVEVDRLYINGQAHGQCGDWHTDVAPGSINCFTIVYFFKEWLPEYGGHLLIRTDPVTSIIPEFNKAVLFDSTIEHVGLEPTMHCKTQRESIACKFRIL